MKKISKTTRRAKRVRSALKQGKDRLRLTVFRSNAHIWAQIVDDTQHTTLLSANDVGLSGTKTERAKAVGQKIGQAAKAKGLTNIVFDRGSYRYHGRVKALSAAARDAGLIF